MDSDMMARAQYDSKAHREDIKRSSKYEFETPIVEDENGNFAHELIITRKSDNTVMCDRKFYTVEELDDAMADWKVQLGISSIDTNMWGS